MRNRILLVVLIFACLFASACGSIATPPPSSADLTASAAEAHGDENVSEEEEVAVVPTATSIPPTATPTNIPPTATTVQPTATTEAPAAAAEPTRDPVSIIVEVAGNPANGEQLFTTTYQTTQGPFACSTCHNVITDDQLIGPGLLTIRERAAQRIPGVSAESYILSSIIHPSEYVLQGFVDGLMPQNYEQLLSEQERYDIIAYLLTLGQ